MSASEEPKTALAHGATPEEIGEYWDTHSTADIWDQMEEVHFTIGFGRRRHVAVDPDMYAQVAEYARDRGLVPETVINLWLAERLSEVRDAARRQPAAAAEACESESAHAA